MAAAIGIVVGVAIGVVITAIVAVVGGEYFQPDRTRDGIDGRL
jgi:putative Ca2+/H+ antiporter (TMEM165/GDT1 family)